MPSNSRHASIASSSIPKAIDVTGDARPSPDPSAVLVQNRELHLVKAMVHEVDTLVSTGPRRWDR